ncbi:ABC transporter permease subunit [Anaerocolumna sedimenticola]|uniref:ABC transporter permease subunit n=1 Tax=Anaerocolumna sedimenticola TaxID=2696063 RepID=A0A6P1TIC3_9FIRM|nr:carbohydrate ABC transporter permease [Anaerocolumna sedimenticola]QHQ59666.1 ABC transporter permease subunit [Anaerocolumna sedimenticola]
MKKSHIREISYHIFLIVFGVGMLYPLIWMLFSSFKPNTEIFKGLSLLPQQWIIDNYIEGWKGISGVTYAKFFLNSFFLVICAVIGNVCSCILAAYAFGKLKFPLKGFWFSIMLVTLMLPMHVKLIPQYIMYNSFGWVNTYLPLIVPKYLATDGFFIFLMTQFIRALPREIDEAAIVDGCGTFKLFARIVVPLSIPAIITTSIFTFLWTWNDFFGQMIYISDVKKYTVSLALRQFIDTMGNSSWGGLFAMSILSLVPLFMMFVIFQNYLVEGITAGSVKG